MQPQQAINSDTQAEIKEYALLIAELKTERDASNNSAERYNLFKQIQDLYLLKFELLGISLESTPDPGDRPKLSLAK